MEDLRGNGRRLQRSISTSIRYASSPAWPEDILRLFMGDYQMDADSTLPHPELRARPLTSSSLSCFLEASLSTCVKRSSATHAVSTWNGRLQRRNSKHLASVWASIVSRETSSGW
jgi:hypothetical protein